MQLDSSGIFVLCCILVYAGFRRDSYFASTGGYPAGSILFRNMHGRFWASSFVQSTQFLNSASGSSQGKLPK